MPGGPSTPSCSPSAARRAYNAHDLVLAERLAAAARAAGGGVEAGLVLAETALLVGRHEEAAALLDELSARCGHRSSSGSTSPTRGRSPSGCSSGARTRRSPSSTRRWRVVHDPDLVDPLMRLVGDRARPGAQARGGRSPRPARCSTDRRARASRGRLRRVDRVGPVGCAGRGDRARAARPRRRISALGPAIHFLPEAQLIGPVLRCAARPAAARWGRRARRPGLRRGGTRPARRPAGLVRACSAARRPSTVVGWARPGGSSARRPP